MRNHGGVCGAHADDEGGDPQGMAKAKMGLVGALGGLEMSETAKTPLVAGGLPFWKTFSGGRQMSELGLLRAALPGLLIIVGGGVCTIMVGYAWIMWMMSGGDPQGMAKAKMALLGALGGLVVVGLGLSCLGSSARRLCSRLGSRFRH